MSGLLGDWVYVGGGLMARQGLVEPRDALDAGWYVHSSDWTTTPLYRAVCEALRFNPLVPRTLMQQLRVDWLVGLQVVEPRAALRLVDTA